MKLYSQPNTVLSL